MKYFNNFTLKSILLLIHVLILGIAINEVNSLTPIGRAAHATAFDGTKIYMLGGAISNGPDDLNEVIYLDVSKSFNSKNPPWNLSTPMPIGAAFSSASFIYNGNRTIYLFGGNMFNPVTHNESYQSFIYAFNLQTLKWDIPITKGKIPSRLTQFGAVKDNFGKIYIFGGGNNLYGTLSEEMNIFDTNTLTWSNGSKLYWPGARHSYAATLLPDGVIVYTGGLYAGNKAMNISDVVLYNTKLNSWEVMTAKNVNAIGSRFGHTAVLAPNGQIIVCGGTNSIDTKVQVTPNLVVLDTRKKPFEWIVPPVSSNVGE
ncbi:14863_t:CDS:2, partial [Racocetra fulgida]